MNDNSIDISEMSLTQQAQYIIKTAEKFGVEQNFLFITTFKRYQMQINILSKLERHIADGGLMVEKTYVKGKSNTYTNPAIKDYNRTADSANGTLQKLLLIIRTLRRDAADNVDDPLVRLLNGEREEGDEDDDSEEFFDELEADSETNVHREIIEDKGLTAGGGNGKGKGFKKPAAKKAASKKTRTPKK